LTLSLRITDVLICCLDNSSWW